VLLGAALAGAAIENSMLGAAHAAANPLTSQFGVIHGQAVGLMLPSVVRFNGSDQEARSIYHELAVDAGRVGNDHNPERSVHALARYLEEFREVAHLPGSFPELDVHDPDLQALADQAATQWTASFNPRPVTSGDFLRLYRSVAGVEKQAPPSPGS
jgi:alcohol dehydrogenase